MNELYDFEVIFFFNFQKSYVKMSNMATPRISLQFLCPFLYHIYVAKGKISDRNLRRFVPIVFNSKQAKVGCLISIHLGQCMQSGWCASVRFGRFYLFKRGISSRSPHTVCILNCHSSEASCPGSPQYID